MRESVDVLAFGEVLWDVIEVDDAAALPTPRAIPANMLVLEPGNLRFRDFFRCGLAVSAVAFAVSMLVLPLAYPFYPK